MEFGNIGNYYVAQPLFKGLRQVFPEADIRTTFQMSDQFAQEFRLTTLPLDLYYGWGQDNKRLALAEFGAATLERSTGVQAWTSDYMDEVRAADLVIDYSGDIWGDNADSLSEDRFLVGALKNRIAQLLGAPIALVAGSPGPLDSELNLALAKLVYPNFDLVTHREPTSNEIFRKYGLNSRREETLACPAFLFEADGIGTEIVEQVRREFLGRPIIGLAVSGWNITPGPFDRWPRSRQEFGAIASAAIHLVERLDAVVLLLSHSNGFSPPPSTFELLPGRDFVIMSEIHQILLESSVGDHVRLIEDPLFPSSMKSLLSDLDMLVTGRVHAAVAAMSSAVPTVMLDYAFAPVAHKVKGFAKLTQMSDYVADPTTPHGIITAIDRCWSRREEIRQELTERIPELKALANQNFELLRLLATDNRRSNVCAP